MTSQAQKDNYKRQREQAVPQDLMPWHYVGGVCMAINGAFEVALPADASCVVLEARGGAVNYSVNGVTASATSPGYVAADGARTIGPLSNLDRLWVYGGDASTYAHLQFYREGP